MNKSTKIVGLIGFLIGIFQLLLDTLNIADLSTETKTFIGAIGIFLTLSATGLKQYFDTETPNSTLWIQLLLFVAYISGGLLDKFDLIPLNNEGKSILRVILTFFVSVVPMIVNYLKSPTFIGPPTNNLVGPQPQDPRDNPPPKP